MVLPLGPACQQMAMKGCRIIKGDAPNSWVYCQSVLVVRKQAENTGSSLQMSFKLSSFISKKPQKHVFGLF